MIRTFLLIYLFSFSFSVLAQETVSNQQGWFIGGGVESKLKILTESDFQVFDFNFSLVAGKKLGNHWNVGLHFSNVRRSLLLDFKKSDIEGFNTKKSEFGVGVFGRYQTSSINKIALYFEPSLNYQLGLISNLAFGFNYRISEKFRFTLQMMQIRFFSYRDDDNKNSSFDIGLQDNPYFTLKGEYFIFNKRNDDDQKLTLSKYIFAGGDFSYYKRNDENKFGLVSYVGFDFFNHFGGGIIFQSNRYEWSNEFDSAFLKTKYQGFGIFVRFQKRFERVHLFIQSSVMFNKSISESMNANVAHSDAKLLSVTLSPNISYHLIQNLFLNISPGHISYENIDFESGAFQDTKEIALKFGLQHLKIGLELKFKQIPSFQN